MIQSKSFLKIFYAFAGKVIAPKKLKQLQAEKIKKVRTSRMVRIVTLVCYLHVLKLDNINFAKIILAKM